MNASTERSAWRRIERSVPRANSRRIGTITVLPASFRSFRWLPRWLTSLKPPWPVRALRRGRRRWGGSGSRRDVDRRNDRGIDAIRKRLILEVELEGLAEVLQCGLDALALARDFDFQAAGNVPGRFVGDRGGEAHVLQSTAVELIPESAPRLGSQVGAILYGPGWTTVDASGSESPCRGHLRTPLTYGSRRERPDPPGGETGLGGPLSPRHPAWRRSPVDVRSGSRSGRPSCPGPP